MLFTQIKQLLPYDAVDAQKFKKLAELRFCVQGQANQDVYFKNLLMSADFWVSAACKNRKNGFEAMVEFWSLVKTIYS